MFEHNVTDYGGEIRLDGVTDVAFTVADFFSGAGGLTCGFRRAGFNPLYAIDCWSPAVRTYELNHGHHIEHGSVHESSAVPDADVFVGGPPCQGFSSAGRRVADDERNSLVRIYANLIARHRPKAFVFENVEGFLTTGGGRFLIDLLEPVLAAGYKVHFRKVNAANFGVPQHRKRVLAIGGLGFDPSFPEFSHSAAGAPGAHLVGSGKPTTPSVRDAIGTLPLPSAEPPGSPADHYSKPLTDGWAQRCKLLKPGQCMRDLPEHLWHGSYHRRANRRVADGMPTEKRGGAPAGIRRLQPDEPSKAITGAALRDFIHYEQDRCLTIRECARLQTFPDDFQFVGTPAEKVQQIGNSVPPLLGYKIAAHLALVLRKNRVADSPGELLSFKPTASEGMSPALQKTCDLVRRLFSQRVSQSEEMLLWNL